MKCGCTFPGKLPTLFDSLESMNITTESVARFRRRLACWVLCVAGLAGAHAGAEPRDDHEQQMAKGFYRQLETIEREKEIKLLGLGRTVEQEPFKSYHERYRQRVEAYGSSRYPTYRGHSIYGSATLLVRIARDGSLVSVDEIGKSSIQIAAHATALLKEMGVFEPFPPDMAALVREVGVISVLRFHRDEHSP